MTKAANAELAEMGEETDNMITTQSKLRETIMNATKVASNNFKGIDILNDNGNYQSTFVILQNIADIYDEIIKRDKETGSNNINLLLETIAGKNRANIASSIISNGDILRSAYESAQNAEGTGQEELDKKMDSIEMKINEFRNAVSKLASDWIDTGFVSMVVEGATTVVKFIDAITNAIGGLASTITVLLGLLTGKNLMDKILGTTNSDGSKKDWWWKTLKEFTEGVKGVTQEGFEEAVNTKAVDDNTRSLEANSAAQVRNNAVKGEGALVNATDTVAEEANSASNLENATSNDIDTASQNANNASKIAGATANSTEGTSYMGGKLRSLGGLFGKGGAKIGGLLGIGATGGSLLLGGGILAAVGALGYFLTAEQRAEEEAKKIAEAYKEAEGNIKSATEEINKAKSIDVEEKAKTFSDLAQGVNLETNANISLTTEQYEEFLSVSKEISELYPELTKGYDDNGNALLDLSSDVDTVTESLKKLKDQQIADAEQEIVNNLDDLVKGYKQNIESSNTAIDEQKPISAKEQLENIVKPKEIDEEGNITFKIQVGDDDTGQKAKSLVELDKFIKDNGLEILNRDYNAWSTTHTITIANPEETFKTLDKNNQQVYENFVESEKEKQKKLTSKINEDLLAWVHQTATYSNNEDIQKALDNTVKNIDWTTIDETSKFKGFEDYKNYLNTNIINEFDKLVEDNPLREKLVEMLSLSPEDYEDNLEEYVKSVENLQKDLKKEDINIPITPIIEDEKEILKALEDNVSSISEKYDEKGIPILTDYEELKKYLSDNNITSKAQIEEFNKYTAGIKGADKAIKTYKKGIATAEQGSARVSKIMQDYNMVLDEAIQSVTENLPSTIDSTDISDELIQIFKANEYSLQGLITGEINLGSDTVQNVISNFDIKNLVKLERYLTELKELSGYAEEDLLKYMKNYQTKELAKQIDDLWNGDDFKETKKDLEKLARTTGITANDVKGLAEENQILSDVLDTSGMSAEYLASVFNDMCVDGASAMDTLNSDVMELNRVFDLMTGRIKEADDAYSKWKASTEQGDYDDQYKNVQEVYQDLEERLKNGDMGKNTRRDVEFLFGKGHGNDTFDEIVKLVKQNKKFVAEDVWNDDGTKVKKTGGEYGTKFIKYLAENFSKEIADLGDSVSYDKKTGQWSWDIAPENIDKIAEMAGVSSNFVTAMLEATGKVGKIKNYDLDALEETITNKLNMSVKYGKKGKVAVSKQGLESLLQQTGYEDWFIEQVMESVQTEMDNVKTLDFEDKSKENINNIIDTLVKAGKLTDVSNGVNLQELVNALSQMNMPTDQIIEFAKAVPKAKQVVDDFGHTYKKNMIEGAIKNNPTALLSAGFLDIKYAAEQASATLESFNTNQKEGFKLQGKDFSLNMESTDIDDVESQIERWTKMLEPYKEVNKNGDTVINWNKNKEEITAVANGLIGLISLKQKLVRENTEIFSVDTTNLDETQTKFIEQANQIQDLADTYEVKLTFGEDTTAIKEQILMAMGNFKETAKNAGVSIFDIIDTSDMSKFDESLSQWTKGIKDEDLAESMGVDDFDKKTKKSIATLADNLNKVFTGEQELKIKLVLDGKSTDIKILGGIFGGGTTTTTTSVSDAMNGDSRFSTTSSSDVPLTPEELVKKRFGIKPKAHGTNSDGIEKDQIALVNELGNETIVRDGELFEMKGGAHFEKLQKGDIIFNHKQTEELKKKGKLSNNGRGKLIGGSSAFASGTFKGSIAQISNAFSGESASNTGGTIKHYVSDDDKDNKKNKKSPSKETFDWIEVLLSRIQRTIAKLETTVSNTYKNWTTRESALVKEERKVKEEINYQTRGAKRYQKEANKYVGGIRKYAGSKKKGDDYIKKIQEGRIDIETIKYTSGEDGKKTNKEQLVEKLKLYQQWYNKVLECQDAVEELRIKESELAKQRFDNTVSKYDDKLSTLENSKAVTEEKLNYRQAQRNAQTLREQGIFDQTSKNYYKDLKNNTLQRQAKLTEKATAMQKDFNNAVSSGKIKKGSTTWYEMRNAIEAVKLEEQQCKSELLEYDEAIKNLHVEQFDAIGERFDNILAKNEHKSNMLNGYINQAELNGNFVSTKYYETLRQTEKDNINKRTNELSQQKQALADAMADGLQVGSSQWFEMTKAIDATTEAIQQSENAMKEYNNSIRDLGYEQFERIQETISGITEESNFLIELMSEENMFEPVKEKDGKVIGGEITKQGMATLGLYGQNYNVALEQSKKYSEKIAEIEKDLAEDPYNKKLIDKKKEYVQAQRESILAANKEKQSMKSLVQEGYQAQLEAMKKMIDLYGTALDSQKNLLDRQMSVRDQSKTITDLEKQLSAYANNNTEEGRVKKQELQKQLQEAKENQKQSEMEYSISEQKKMLEDTYSKYEQNLNEQLEDIDKLIPQVISGANQNAKDIQDTLITEAGAVGTNVSESMNTIWGSGKPLATNIEGINKGVSGVSDTISREVNKVYVAIEESNRIAAEKINSPGTESSQDSKEATTSSGLKEFVSTITSNTNKNSTNNKNTNTKNSNTKWGSWFISKKYSGKKVKSNTSIVDRLNYFNFDSSPSARAKYYKAMGKKDKYTGSAKQNTWMLEQMKKKGYASGTRKVKEDELAWTQEKGREAIIRPSDGAILTPLAKSDSVLKASATSNLFDFANNPTEFISGLGLGTNGNPNVTQNTVTNNSNINLEVTLPSVKNYEDFKYAMQHDKNFEKMIQSMTTDRLFGGSSLKKYR